MTRATFYPLADGARLPRPSTRGAPRFPGRWTRPHPGGARIRGSKGGVGTPFGDAPWAPPGAGDTGPGSRDPPGSGPGLDFKVMIQRCESPRGGTYPKGVLPRTSIAPHPPTRRGPEERPEAGAGSPGENYPGGAGPARDGGRGAAADAGKRKRGASSPSPPRGRGPAPAPGAGPRRTPGGEEKRARKRGGKPSPNLFSKVGATTPRSSPHPLWLYSFPNASFHHPSCLSSVFLPFQEIRRPPAIPSPPPGRGTARARGGITAKPTPRKPGPRGPPAASKEPPGEATPQPRGPFRGAGEGGKVLGPPRHPKSAGTPDPDAHGRPAAKSHRAFPTPLPHRASPLAFGPRKHLGGVCPDGGPRQRGSRPGMGPGGGAGGPGGGGPERHTPQPSRARRGPGIPGRGGGGGSPHRHYRMKGPGDPPFKRGEAS